MIINLDRRPSSKKATNGELFVNSAFLCYSLEDIVRPEGVKVYGDTAIPQGTYDLFMLPFRGDATRIYPHLDHVPGFTGIAIHGGNTAADTLGCILVGFKEAVDYVGDCKPALARLCYLINQAIARDEKIKIEIKNG